MIRGLCVRFACVWLCLASGCKDFNPAARVQPPAAGAAADSGLAQPLDAGAEEDAGRVRE